MSGVLSTVLGAGQQLLGLLDPSYRIATLRGLPFYVPGGTSSGGRRWVTHEFPGRDDPWHEDLGQRLRTLDIEGILIGDEVDEQVSEFQEALDAPGIAAFSHPWFGLLDVAILEGRITRSEQERRVARVSLRLQRAGERPAPLLAADGLAGVLARINSVRQALLRGLARLRALIALPRLLLGALRNQVLGIVGQLRGAWASLSAPWALSLREPVAVSSRRALSSLPDAILGDPAALGPIYLAIPRGVSLLAVPRTQGEAEPVRGLWPTGQAEAQPVLLALLALGRPPVPPPGFAASLSPWDAAFQAATAVEAARVLVYMPFTSRPDAIAARDAVAAALDAAADALALAGLDEAWAELIGLRAALVADTSVRAARLPALRQVVLPATMPAALAAYRLDGDALDTVFGRGGELVARNRVRHPLFTPGGVDLEVLR